MGSSAVRESGLASPGRAWHGRVTGVADDGRRKTDHPLQVQPVSLALYVTQASRTRRSTTGRASQQDAGVGGGGRSTSRAAANLPADDATLRGSSEPRAISTCSVGAEPTGQSLVQPNLAALANHSSKYCLGSAQPRVEKQQPGSQMIWTSCSLVSARMRKRRPFRLAKKTSASSPPESCQPTQQGGF